MTDLNLTQEEQFILTCLRSEFSGSSEADFSALDLQSMNWDTVYKKSTEWNIAELLYRIIKKHPSFLKTAKIPKLFLETMRLKYFMTCVANDSMFKSLSEVLEVFHKADIKVILLKGSHLAQFVYQDAGVRPMCDIDILVRKEEMGDINKMLNTLGYKAEPLYKWCLHNSYCVNYYHINKVRLQIHWELFSPDRFSQPIQPLPNKILWENAIPIDQENIRAHILSNETNVVYMCLHAAKHSREGIALLKFLDIALFLKKNAHGINKAYFLELVRDSKLETLMCHILQISKEYFDIDISLLKDIESRHESPDDNISGYFRENKVEPALIRYCKVLYNIPGFYGKFYTLFHYSFPSREYLIHLYGVKKYYLFTHLYDLLRRKG